MENTTVVEPKVENGLDNMVHSEMKNTNFFPSVISMLKKEDGCLSLEKEKDVNLILLLDNSDEVNFDVDIEEEEGETEKYNNNKTIYLPMSGANVFVLSGVPYKVEENFIRTVEISEMVNGSSIDPSVQCLDVKQHQLRKLGFEKAYFSNQSMGMKNTLIRGICGKEARNVYGHVLLVKKNIIKKD